VNTNDYRDNRINPPEIPFRNVAIDHIGPFTVSYNDVKCKSYIVIVTCLWSRAVNLLVCKNINNECFLRALQYHILEYGIMQHILSDNGSPIVSSVHSIQSFLDDTDVNNFLKERNIKSLEFSPYPAEASKLGGTVESLVKQVKNMIYSTIRNNTLSFDDFTYLVRESNVLINKRPLTFFESIRDTSTNSIDPITPEMLLKGYDVPNILIIPQLQPTDENDADFPLRSDPLSEKFSRLRRVRCKLKEIYFDQFLQNLRDLSTRKSDMYKQVKHVPLKINDLVAIKTKFSKPYFYPTALVIGVETNDLKEVSAVTLKKSNGQVIRRHVEDLIFLESTEPRLVTDNKDKSFVPIKSLPRRAAAQKCIALNKQIFEK